MQRLYTEFGRLLREARNSNDLTQEEVGRRVGLTRTSITNIERGSQHISLEQLFLLANAVGRSPVDLLPADNLQLEDLLAPEALAELDLSEEGEEFAVRVLRNNPRVARAVSASDDE